MINVVVVAVASLLLLLAGASGHAAEIVRDHLSSALVYYGETPPGFTLSVSVSNADPRRNAHAQPSCEKAEATFLVLGTIPSTSQDTDAVRKLELLYRRRMVLSQGEVQRFEFLQPARTTETVILETVMSDRDARCLVHSNVSVLNAAGDLVSVAPPAEPGPLVKYYALASDGSEIPLYCCPCAPLCECGVCF